MIKEVLERIDAGEQAFSANQDDPESIKDFQAFARALKAAKHRGYVSDVSFIRSKKRDTPTLYLEACVTGGLSYEGQKQLTAYRASPIAHLIAGTAKALPKILIGVAVVVIGGLLLRACLS